MWGAPAKTGKYADEGSSDEGQDEGTDEDGEEQEDNDDGDDDDEERREREEVERELVAGLGGLDVFGNTISAAARVEGR